MPKRKLPTPAYPPVPMPEDYPTMPCPPLLDPEVWEYLKASAYKHHILNPFEILEHPCTYDDSLRDYLDAWAEALGLPHWTHYPLPRESSIWLDHPFPIHQHLSPMQRKRVQALFPPGHQILYRDVVALPQPLRKLPPQTLHILRFQLKWAGCPQPEWLWDLPNPRLRSRDNWPLRSEVANARAALWQSGQYRR